MAGSSRHAPPWEAWLTPQLNLQDTNNHRSVPEGQRAGLQAGSLSWPAASRLLAQGLACSGQLHSHRRLLHDAHKRVGPPACRHCGQY